MEVLWDRVGVPRWYPSKVRMGYPLARTGMECPPPPPGQDWVPPSQPDEDRVPPPPPGQGWRTSPQPGQVRIGHPSARSGQDGVPTPWQDQPRTVYDTVGMPLAISAEGLSCFSCFCTTKRKLNIKPFSFPLHLSNWNRKLYPHKYG